MTPPHGYGAIAEFYGWDDRYFTADGHCPDSWPDRNLEMIALPQLLLYGGRPVQRMRVHRRVADLFRQVYEAIHSEGLWWLLSPYGGSFAWRLKRGVDELSMHSFGCAVDHGTRDNPLGAPPEVCSFGNTDAGRKVVAIFEDRGFKWGGTFSGRKDCQHFQFATGA